MRIRSFIKRLNATEIGSGVTNDTFIAIPREVDLSHMLVNQEAMTLYDRCNGVLFTPASSNIKYVQTGQNNQERISGLGQYYSSVNAKVGDEILIERVDRGNNKELFLDFRHRNSIVFQKNNDGFEILTPEEIGPYRNGDNYTMDIIFENKTLPLEVRFILRKKKKRTSPTETDFFDLIIDGNSILQRYNYQEYVEITTDDMIFGKMKTFVFSDITAEDDYE